MARLSKCKVSFYLAKLTFFSSKRKRRMERRADSRPRQRSWKRSIRNRSLWSSRF